MVTGPASTTGRHLVLVGVVRAGKTTLGEAVGARRETPFGDVGPVAEQRVGTAPVGTLEHGGAPLPGAGGRGRWVPPAPRREARCGAHARARARCSRGAGSG